jgi:pyruvate-ferredoxin/flavodoxin oxidoreductase
MESAIGTELAAGLLAADQASEAGIEAQRSRVAALKEKLKGQATSDARNLASLADVLVLDTEVYSNTGGQCSKATPRGAVAKFAAGGKPIGKKDFGLIAMSYGHIYVATVAYGANDLQTVKAFMEAEAYDGPSIILAYSHCIAHGIDMKTGIDNQDRAVNSGHWPLYRFNPALIAKGENPLRLDSKTPKIKFEDYAYNETRWKMLTKSKPEDAKRLFEQAQRDADTRWQFYTYMASRKGAAESNPVAAAAAAAVAAQS